MSLAPATAISGSPTPASFALSTQERDATHQNEPSAQNEPHKINTYHTHRDTNGRRTNSGKCKTFEFDIEWKLRWTPERFRNGRLLLIDYIRNDCTGHAGRRRIVATEFQDVKGLRSFYENRDYANQAALRVIHVQNAPWARDFLMKKFHIDQQDDLVGTDLGRWARNESPLHRSGRPVPDGRSWKLKNDPWRNVSRMAFGMDYLKCYEARSPLSRSRAPISIRNAKMMQLNCYQDGHSHYGYDVCVQRLSVYVQRDDGPLQSSSGATGVQNPYAQARPKNIQEQASSAPVRSCDQDYVPMLETLDNGNTIIVLDSSACESIEHTLIKARVDVEKRWRRLPFYIKKEAALDDDLMAMACTHQILDDVWQAVGTSWEDFLNIAGPHVTMLEDKIYENPADESRAPELWTNSSHWLKAEKLMWIHIDVIKESQGYLTELADIEGPQEEWLAGPSTQLQKLSNNIQEDLVKPTASLTDLLYKSVGIRDSRHSLQLGMSMWRLSWITFIFLPLTFIVGFFGMNLDTFNNHPSIRWYFLSAIVLMLFVLCLWYSVKHSTARKRQTSYQRGIYERLFADLTVEHPRLWSDSGASADIRPATLRSSLKWRIINYWFSPKNTIQAKTVDLDPDGEYGLGIWAGFKRKLLRRWLREIDTAQAAADAADPEPERRAVRVGVASGPTLTQFVTSATAVALAEGEPPIAVQGSNCGLSPLHKRGRRSDSSRDCSERPSSRASNGIMVEEQDPSEDEREPDAATGDRAESEGGSANDSLVARAE
ncbi:hypothetical protein LTR50_002556 [Elasticomyces elasticus]|nr:hypothetical protein LTR50_002556 [Elasticomyces elasticus]